VDLAVTLTRAKEVGERTDRGDEGAGKTILVLGENEKVLLKKSTTYARRERQN